MIEKYLNRIIQGDAIAVLREIPDCTVDAIITDPPYCSGGRSISQRQQATSKKYEKYLKKQKAAGERQPGMDALV